MTSAQHRRWLREIRADRAARLARLRVAGDMLREARYRDVVSDGQDIVNCELERLEKEVRDLEAQMQMEAADGAG